MTILTIFFVIVLFFVPFNSNFPHFIDIIDYLFDMKVFKIIFKSNADDLTFFYWYVKISVFLFYIKSNRRYTFSW